MLVYYVQWIPDKELAKGKGRITRSDYFFGFTVMCRNTKDATACLEYLFDTKYNGKFSLSDGEIKLSRYTLDSRNFSVQYLLMDGMSKPLYLSDCKRSIDTYHANIYQVSTYRNDLSNQI